MSDFVTVASEQRCCLIGRHGLRIASCVPVTCRLQLEVITRNQFTCLSHNCSIDEAFGWSRCGVMHSIRAAKGGWRPLPLHQPRKVRPLHV